MTEAEWLDCTDPQKMLSFIRDNAGDRKLRLFAVACCRRIWHLLTDERSQRAVELAERYADGRASEDELWQGHLAARVALVEQPGEGLTPAKDAAYTALAAAFHSRGARNYTDIGPIGLIDAAGRAAVYSHCASAPENDDFAAEAALLRCIFGDPFRPVTISPAWLTSTVKTLATAIYDNRRFEDLPILADALEDAGCTNADILAHCRGPGPHVRGCWVLDLLHNDFAKASDLWQAGQPQGAGRLILEHLPAEDCPKWAARILRLVMKRSGMATGPPYLSPAGPRERSHLERILEIAENGQWALGHRCFDNLRASTLEFNEMQRRRGLTQDEETVAHLLLLAELVAKVTYNAADPPDPFDEDSGWYIAPSLRHFVDMWKDEEFSKAAWSALCCEEG